jgi:sulfonate transport system ATP-binding protein
MSRPKTALSVINEAHADHSGDGLTSVRSLGLRGGQHLSLASASAVLAVEGVSKTFQLNGKALTVLSDFSLAVTKGEFISIVGSSGCGKSTLLRLIAGLDGAYDGNIVWLGDKVSGTSLDRGLVFQEHRLFPWLTVEQNVALALESSGLTQQEIDTRVKHQIELVGLTGFAQAYPHQISGGMSQRVAIARGLVLKPRLLLLDEPFGALDALTRLKMQQELQRLWETEGTTSILVTHDVEEAVFLGDRVVVMEANPGRIKRVVEVDLPRPRHRASAEFQRIKDDVLSDFIEIS